MNDPVTRYRARWAAILATFVLVVVAGQKALPSLGHGTVAIDGQPAVAGDLPVVVTTPEAKRIEVTFPLDVPVFALRPRRTLVIPDDCVEKITVNGADFTSPARFCGYENGRVIDLSPVLREGSNEIHVFVVNRSGHMGLDVSLRLDRAFAAFALTLFSLAACGAVVGLRRSKRRPVRGALLGMLVAGAALRTLYVLTTPAAVRGHDAGKHLDYVRYVAAHWSLPLPHEGFEFYQPPLYYVLAAPLVRLAHWRGAVDGDAWFLLQLVALGLSVAALWLALGTLRALLAAAARSGDAGRMRADFVVGGSLLAVFTSLVFFAARINNDVLVQATSFGGLALLVAFWRSQRTATWAAFSLCVGLGLVTKSNTLVVAATGVVCLAAARAIDAPRKSRLAALLAGVVAAVAGWFVLPRWLEERRAKGFLVSNTSWLNHKLILKNTADSLLGVHPLQVLEHPYNTPWSDAGGRQLWGYFVRSSLFGEFGFGAGMVPLCRALLVLLSLLTAVGLCGWWTSLRHRFRQDLPLHALVALSLASQFAFRVMSPFSPSQDFRYSFLLVLPFAYFVALGLRDLPVWLRRTATVAWAAFVVGSAFFVVTLWAKGTV